MPPSVIPNLLIPAVAYQSLPIGASLCTLTKRCIHKQRNMWNKPKNPQNWKQCQRNGNLLHGCFPVLLAPCPKKRERRRLIERKRGERGEKGEEKREEKRGGEGRKENGIMTRKESC